MLCWSYQLTHSANQHKREKHPMERKCLATLGTALTILVSSLTGASGAATSTYKILHVFEGAKNPSGGLTWDGGGNLYGTTMFGGAHDAGTVFKLKPNPDGTWTSRILHSFRGEDGRNPGAGVIFDAAGNLYGTTNWGGACCGVVFKLAPKPDGTWTESVLYRFTGGADGLRPLARLVFDAAGNLYGTTSNGGASGLGCDTNPGCGVVFKLTPEPDGTWRESVLDTFTGANGLYPVAGLLFDATGNLYGTTVIGGDLTCLSGAGCGVVFKLTPNPDGTWTETVLHSFTGGDGAEPYAGLVFDAAGDLYGTTSWGGAYYGVVFKLAPRADGTWKESVLHSFTGSDGAGSSTLIFDAAGNLYGTAGGGIGCAQAGCGVVFKLTPTASGWTERVLHFFKGYGQYPSGPVIFDQVGNLYGTAYSGSNNYGLVFEITP
jgi:uncharacterized repeat protein (TIGR03803 family)